MSPYKPLTDMAQRDLDNLVGITERELADLNTQRKAKAAFLQSVREEMERRKREKTFKPGISDHATLRYLQRFAGIDVDGLKQKLLTAGLTSALKSGASRYTADGVTYVLRDDTVITIVEAQ